MTKSTPVEKRPYLGKDDRKKALLNCAAELVEEAGWGVLNMSALADRAGVSRQLVYQHFPNLESLLGATAWVVFTDTMEGTAQAIASHPDDLKQAIRAAELVSLDMPVGRGDALWQLIAGSGLNSPELETIRLGIRDVILKLWVPAVRKEKNLDKAAATSLVWMVILSFWGIRQLIRDGLVSREQGIAQFDSLLDRLM
ncbi:MAG: TetR/AcrR family transcriptional regulator [Limnobacter sp.]|uniref:TetR/AcrR family transcriptional regulator n=1 Tax=Limnobacter sp. TaxID=2003368 RepID=UPI0022BBEC06|nr:TetR/AcrR family transcriptional regulator [Limnobacter sp.]MCZ8015215.1 TetR/AcrR family transcriptional regulator [Limnobacter sp.]